MPHAFLMNEETMSKANAYLLRCRLHIRGGKTLLDNQRRLHMLATLYDAVESGMRWYYLHHYNDQDNEILNDSNKLNEFLKQNGIFTTNFDFTALEELVERSLDDEDGIELRNLDLEDFWIRITEFLNKLGIYPFDETLLPEENEETKIMLK